MAVKNIVCYPDPILKTFCPPVERVDSAILQLIDETADGSAADEGTDR